jgi:hypothetical protein
MSQSKPFLDVTKRSPSGSKNAIFGCYPDLLSSVTDSGLDNWEIRIQFPEGAEIFSSSLQCPDQLWDQLNLLASGYQEPFPWELKQQGHDTDRSYTSTAKVKKVGATPPLPTCLHGVVLNLAWG